MGTTPSAPPASDAEMSGVAWEWEDDGPTWKPYRPNDAKLLEGAYRAQKDHTVLTFGRTKYVVHLDTMMQENTSSHYSRTIRRTGPAPPKFTAKSTGGLVEFQDDHGWRPYGATHAKMILAAHANGKSSVQIKLGRGTYTVDFTSMVQRNDGTGFTRPIRLTTASGATAATAATAGASAASSRAGGAGGAGAGSAAGPSVYADEVCDPSRAATAAKLDKSQVALLTGWVAAKSLDEVKDQSCAVCILDYDEDDDLSEVVRLGQCKGHFFHADCIVQAFSYSVKCPICSQAYAVELGDMPKGTMKITRYPPGQYNLSGYSGEGTMVIQYHFPSGTQRDEHPNPGKGYSGTSRTAYLPDTVEGREVADLLVQAFRNRQSFTIGTSVTTGRTDTVVWNGIHHKTNTSGGSSRFGYPDETYFKRVKEELALIGITPPGAADADVDADGDVDMGADSDADAAAPAGAGGSAGAGAAGSSA